MKKRIGIIVIATAIVSVGATILVHSLTENESKVEKFTLLQHRSL